MGWAERWMRRFFVLAVLVALAASTFWIAQPIAARGLRAAARFVGATVAVLQPAHAAAGANDSAPAGEPGVGTSSPSDGAAGGTGGAAVPGGAAGADAAPGPAVEPGAPADGGPTAVVIPSADGYVWPLSGAKITTFFAPAASGSMMLNGQPIHNGIDIARPCGTPIEAAHAGTVIYAGRRADAYLGFSASIQPYYDELTRRKLTDRSLPVMVVIDDGNGLIGVYVHLRLATVSAGQSVQAGETIGLEGRTGNATGCHLHYSLYLADGPWVAVAPTLVEKWHYPPFMRLRIDPLLLLPLDSPDAAHAVAGLFPPSDPPHYVPPEPFSLPPAWH
jgi:murein DD-endopeptidase MepM/ murein hydrolase activator NlpD